MLRKLNCYRRMIECKILRSLIEFNDSMIAKKGGNGCGCGKGGNGCVIKPVLTNCSQVWAPHKIPGSAKETVSGVKDKYS